MRGCYGRDCCHVVLGECARECCASRVWVLYMYMYMYIHVLWSFGDWLAYASISDGAQRQVP